MSLAQSGQSAPVKARALPVNREVPRTPPLLPERQNGSQGSALEYGLKLFEIEAKREVDIKRLQVMKELAVTKAEIEVVAKVEEEEFETFSSHKDKKNTYSQSQKPSREKSFATPSG